MSDKVTGQPQQDAFDSSDERVAQLTKENAQLKLEMERLSVLWQRDRDILETLMLREFPQTEEELQAALAESEPFSAVLSELFPEQVANV